MRRDEATRMHSKVWLRRWGSAHVGLSRTHGRRRRATWLRALGFAAVFFAVSVEWSASFCWAESETRSPDAREILKYGTIEAGGTIGYWQALRFHSKEHSTNRSAVFIMPRVGMVVTDEVQAGVLTGNLEVLVEPFFARFTHPFAAEAAGGALVLKYNLLSFGRWMPFWDAGAGMLWTNLAPRIQEQSTPLNFVIETGPGIQYFLTTQTALTFGVRFSHISNADIGRRNLGLDAVLPYAGISWFLPR
ncbi:MAG: acyloxyacyl hydrolase [Nitrospiraceae bacterium]|nr:MAG: acyloxyacyl hydrolase [Nitrospiraceae bacterium]